MAVSLVLNLAIHQFLEITRGSIDEACSRFMEVTRYSARLQWLSGVNVTAFVLRKWQVLGAPIGCVIMAPGLSQRWGFGAVLSFGFPRGLSAKPQFLATNTYTDIALVKGRETKCWGEQVYRETYIMRLGAQRERWPALLRPSRCRERPHAGSNLSSSLERRLGAVLEA
ncbi:hypothetical protein B0J17DRAFT_628740 [Rhizoctonia solani]|nr:hypothetical protein B0J17DRAFT_628740 [Rhizoctonia solani]